MKISSDLRFAIVPEWLIDAGVPDRAIRLFTVLGRFANSTDQSAYPSRKRLAARMNCSVDTVDRAIRELEQLGAITVVRRERSFGDNDTNMYHLHYAPIGRLAPPPDPDEIDADDHSEDDPDDTDQDGAVAPDLSADVPTGGRTDTAPGSRTHAQPSPHPRGPEREPVNENQMNERTTLLATARVRPADPLWDVLVSELERTPATSSERGRWNRAVKELRSIDATPEQVTAACGEHRRRWPSCELTPTSIAANWSSLLHPPARGRPGAVPRGFAGIREFLEHGGQP